MKFVVPARAVLALGVLLAACEPGTSLSGPSVPTSITATSPLSQTALSGTAAPTAPAVRVLDQRGQPKAGVAVTFAVTAGGGTLGATSATTDAGGYASAGSWILGSAPGTNTVTATVGRVDPLEFTATAQPRLPSALAAVTATSQTAPLGAPVEVRPAVRVSDQVGAPLAGTTVTFAVTGGGGSVAAPTAVTDAQGIATVAGWTVGSAPGANTLRASVAGVAPVEFTATAEGRAPATVRAVDSPATTIVGTAVLDPPSVRVLDHAGQPLAGVTVAFAVTGGGGTVSPASATTSADGLAAVTRWTVGAVPGMNTLTATVVGLPPVTFHVAGETRQPWGLQIASTNPQTGTAGQPVAVRPAVRVTDQASQPLAGATVTFAVASGGGTLTGATATTDAQGIARVGSWTLGSAAGTNTLTARVGALPPVTFTATAEAAPGVCRAGAAYTPGVTVNGALTTSDCRFENGVYFDRHGLSVPDAQRYSFTLRSTAFTPYLEMYTLAGHPVAFHAGADGAQLRVFTRSGIYELLASSAEPGAVGAYELSSTVFAGNEQCLEYWTTAGLAISGRLTVSDCDFGGYYADEYLIYLAAGQTLTLRMESSAVDAYLELYDEGGSLLRDDDDGAGGTNSLLTYTAPADGIFFIVATTFDPGETGGYTLGVTTSAPSAARAGSLAPSSSIQRTRLRRPAQTGDREPAPREAKRPR